MIVHLAFATLVLAAVLALEHLLPLRARTRCALLLLGIFQFAAPAIPARYLGLEPARGAGIVRVLSAPLVNADAAPAAPRVNWLVIVWAAIAAALLARAALAHFGAMRIVRRATPAPEFGRSVVRSAEIDTPALAGILRPVILLPHYVDGFDDASIEALLLHERAHLERHDNVFAAAEAIAGALLWFHPLVWLARRAVAVAREEACDEIVVAQTPRDSYIKALGQVCRAALVPRAAAVSCMASNRLAERITYMNKLSAFRAVPHRITLAAVTALIAFSAAAAGVAADHQPKASKYVLSATMTPLADNQVRFDKKVTMRGKNEIVAQPSVTTTIGSPAEAHIGATDREGHGYEIVVTAKTDDGKNADLSMQVTEDGTVQQTSTTKLRSAASNEPISLKLKNADVHDVARVFGQLTNRKVEVAPGIEGVVSIELVDTPWQEALQQFAAKAGARAEFDGDTIRIVK